MVIGEKDDGQPGAVTHGVPPSSIDNIMSGISNTGSVKMNNHRKKLRQRFDIIKKLGQGTYGKVQLGINKETSQDVAIKTIKKCKIETEADLVRIRREVQIMSSVQHPNIIHIYEVFENREKMVLVMEFAAGGELYDYLSERKVLTEDEARRIFRQIATAVYYCHKHKICHRDLKLENILLDEHGNAKIADFGLSNVFEDKRLLATFCGSPLYASPEIVKGTPYLGPEVDCWSLGVLLYTLVYGAMPFDGSNFKRLVKQISAGDYYEPKKPSNASPLIREMLTVCPNRRATIEQICNHWWVNEGYPDCCLNLAEELANQTPVRLDVLLSLTPSAITSEQMVVPNPNESESKQAVTRSMSVGSIRDIGDIANTVAEQRIIEMVAAGGEAALAPSPTRTISPSASMAQPQVKRKPENTISTESMTGARKRDKPTEQIKNTQSKLSISEVMDVEETPQNVEQTEKNVAELSSSTLPEVVVDQIKKEGKVLKKANKGSANTIIEELPPNTLQKTMTSEPNKASKSFTKTKTTDLSEIARAPPSPPEEITPEEAPKPTTERRKSRIMEVAERFEAATPNVDKPKKFVVPSKKEVERKISAPQPTTTSFVEAKSSKPPTNLPQQSSDKTLNDISKVKDEMASANSSAPDVDLTKSDSKTSNLSLEEARRSMENSIALLNQAKMESNNELDQLCAKTENVAVSSKYDEGERQKKLKHAREIIGNAIPRLSGMGVRKPPVPFGANGRSISGSVVPSATRNVSTPPDARSHDREPLSIYNAKPADQGVINEEQPKLSSAEITLKSATLPRRKIGRPDVEPQQQYHPTYNPVFASGSRGLESKAKEHYIPIQRVGYVANTSSSQRSVLSRQSTNDSDTSDTPTASTTTITTQPSLQTSNSSQPIKKSPREYIIPIAVEGGGFVTPRAGSLEPSESNHSTSTAFSRFSGRPRKISSIFNDSEDESINSPFHRMQRHTSIGRDSDNETNPSTGFTYRLRSTRPFKKLQTTEGNDSGSSGEEDDDDGFEILTAENLFSTLLSRVRALTNRLNVKDDPTSDFPSARFLNNFRQTHSPFWQHDPFTSRLNSSGAWRHSMTRDLGTDIDSVFSPRTGATLPKGAKFRSSGEKGSNVQSNECTSSSENPTNQCDNNIKQTNQETLDLADLDLSQLRLTKKDLETLSSITPSLPKHFQDQLLAQLPPNQARKLSRTLSMQATGRTPTVYKRSSSSGREAVVVENAEMSTSKPSNLDDQSEELKFSENESPTLLSFDRNSVLRRSMSRGRDQTVHRRSTSALRNEFPSRLSYTGDLRTDYSMTKPSDSLASRYRLTDYTSVISPSLKPEYYSKLPLPSTSSISPSKSPPNDTLESPFRRRSSRGLSRFSRPDFYGSASSINAADDSNALLKIRDEKERETQNVLREIRERSRDRARATLSRNDSNAREVEIVANGDGPTHKEHRRKSSIPNIRITVDKQNGRIYHTRNKSMERCCDIDDSEKVDEQQGVHIRRASMTNQSTGRPPVNDSRAQKQSAADFTDDILNELVRQSKEYTEIPQTRGNGEIPQKDTPKKEENGTIKKTKTKSKDGKKTKTKQKSMESIEKDSTFDQQQQQKVKDSKLLTDLSNEVQSVTLPLPKSSKIARRMSYPNKDESESDKINEKKSAVEIPETNVVVSKSSESKEGKIYPNSKLTPPKEMNSKIKKSSLTNSGSAGNARNAITAVMEKFIEKSTERLSPGKSMTALKIKSDSGETSPPKTKKKVKVVKKLAKAEQSPTKETSPKSNDTSNETSPVKERKSPEKKTKSGFLYSIGQKFEKMRESSKNKEKEKKIPKTNETPIATACEIDIKLPINNEKDQPNDMETVQTTIIIPRRVKDSQGESKLQKEEITIREIELPPSISANSMAKLEQRKSRIDAVIRNLRERSVPHTIRVENRESELATESGLLKRAVSVEDMTNGVVNFNKQGNVNKVLGLFRRIEKEHQLQKQQKCSANAVNGESSTKERPKSGGFVSKMKKSSRPYYTGAKSDTIVTLTDQLERQYLNDKANQSLSNSTVSNTKIPFLKSTSVSKSDIQPNASNNFESFEFMANGTKETTSTNGIDEKFRAIDFKRTPNEMVKPQIPIVNVDTMNNSVSEKERIRNNRKGLVLDLTSEQYNDQFKKISNDCSNNNNNNNNSCHFNTNGKSFGTQCNGANDNHVNNNNFAANSNYYHQFYPHSERQNEAHTPDAAASYSSDNRSMRDDCESTSTFLSPTEEPELCFDDWSACSGSTDDQTQLPLHPKHLKYASMRNQTEQNHNQIPSTSVDPASTPSDSESVIDRIKRRSYYCRFNEKKPKRTSSIVGPTAQRDYYREMANKSKTRTSDYLPFTPNGFQTESDGSFSRGGSKSPTPMNMPSSINFKENSSRANTPSCYSTADESEKYKSQPPYHHYHYHQRSQTPSRSVKSPYESNDVTKNKSNEYLNLRSTLTSPPAAISISKYYPNASPSSLPTSDYHHNGNRSYSLRNSAYDSLTSPIVYGTYNPKRRMSTSYLAPSIAAANSTNGYSSSLKDPLSASCYATLGRSKPKAYDHRSLTMLDTGSLTPSSLLTKRISSTNPTLDHAYTHSHYRPVHDYGHFNSRSSLRSPTIIQSSTSNV